MTEKGSLYLIPCMLGEAHPNRGIPPYNREIVQGIDIFIVENVRSARRFLLKAGITKPVDSLTFLQLNNHTDGGEIDTYLDGAMMGKDTGLLSEAGCPAIADPGAAVVRLAHRLNIRVIPLAGPSSILMALMASGMNGQQFAFHGYLPKDKNERIRKIKQVEASTNKEHCTHIFIEAPYRNDALVKDILEACLPDTLLCIAEDILEAGEQINTRTVGEWRKQKLSLNNHPAVFLIGSRAL